MNKYSKNKLKKTENLVKKHLLGFKNILFVGVSGSVGAGGAKKNDDIDILVITKKNRLWMTRLFLNFYIRFKKIPHRRVGKKERKDEFCFNMWLDESSLELPKFKQTKISASDLMFLKAVLNKENIYEKFVGENKRWVDQTVIARNEVTWQSRWRHKLDLFTFPTGSLDRARDDKRFNLFWWLVNLVAFGGQYLYMKPKNERGKSGIRICFFSWKKGKWKIVR